MLPVHIKSGSCNAWGHPGHLFMTHPSPLKPPQSHAYRCSHRFRRLRKCILFREHKQVLSYRIVLPIFLTPGITWNTLGDPRTNQILSFASDCSAVKMTPCCGFLSGHGTTQAVRGSQVQFVLRKPNMYFGFDPIQIPPPGAPELMAGSHVDP